MQPQFQVKGTDVFVEGEGRETIVMVHGWPDTHRLWDAQVAHLKAHYRCVRFTLPGFDGRSPRRAYSLEQVVETIRRVVEQTSPGQKVTLLLHDWGCLFGYQFYVRHAHLVSRIIGVDIGDESTLKKSLSIKAIAMVASYQLWLAAAWLIGGSIGDGMTRLMARLIQCKTDPRLIHSHMTYPYYLFWSRGYSGGVLRPFMPECPMLYLYGTQKPFMFHDPKWTAAIAAQPHSRVQAFETGHWVMVDQPERFNQTVSQWLADTPV